MRRKGGVDLALGSFFIKDKDQRETDRDTRQKRVRDGKKREPVTDWKKKRRRKKGGWRSRKKGGSESEGVGDDVDGNDESGR